MIHELWNKLLIYLKNNDSDVLGNLNNGASSSDIHEAEEIIKKEIEIEKKHNDYKGNSNIKLPEDYVSCLKIHNGQKGTKYNTLFTNFALFSLEEVISAYQSRISSEWSEKTKSDKSIKNTSFNPNWIPIAGHYMLSSVICIDLDPDSGGKKGQIIYLERDSGEDTNKIINNSFSDWFKEIVYARISESDHVLYVSQESFLNSNGAKMRHPQSERTLVTLANASELVNNVAHNIMGNEVADTFGGSPLTRSVLYSLAQTQFQAAFSKYSNSNGVN